MKAFHISALPELILERGAFSSLPGLLRERGFDSIGVVHGRSVYRLRGETLRARLDEEGIGYREAEVSGEPSPDLVDSVAGEWRENPPQLILAVGGGSVLDAGKAVAAMLGEGVPCSVEKFLEGVGDRSPSGRSLPLWAVPTTAGTGSEATKNAVLSRIGGYKKSLRHDNYIPTLACIDPELAADAPARVTAASGLDAITQLIESYLAVGAGPFTDALALSGLEAAAAAFPRLLEALDDLDARAGMGYAAYCSGVTLAHAGLGLIHGAASPLGAAREIPHGVVCGLLLPGTFRRLAAKAAAADDGALSARIGTVETALGATPGSGADYLEGLLNRCDLPGFSDYGFTRSDLAAAAESTGLKNSPVGFSRDEILEIFMERF